MTPSNRLEFLAWYEQQKNKLFDLQRELTDYCISYVDILAKCCLTYRDIFLDLTRSENIENEIGIDPFQHCLTIACCCIFILVIEKSYPMFARMIVFFVIYHKS